VYPQINILKVNLTFSETRVYNLYNKSAETAKLVAIKNNTASLYYNSDRFFAEDKTRAFILF
jgi:hypothetical protein